MESEKNMFIFGGMKTSKINPKADSYFIDGCGRCDLHATPKCKVNFWKEELQLFRMIMLASGLEEEVKWGVPCYTLNGKNVVLIGAFKESCTLNFMKGMLIEDKKGLLSKPGENSHAGRVLRVTSVDEIVKNEKAIRKIIESAIEVERSGKKVPEAENKMPPIPEELAAVFKKKPSVKIAFEALTPGRQRAYLIHFNDAKQSKTRESRIEKSIPKILDGRGFME